ncbi:MAG: phosphate signaling complex protein PhoU [Burkholderiales bacterium]
MEPIRKHFSEQLEEQRERVLYMGGLVEAAVHGSLKALHERDPAVAEEVVQALEPEINRLEVELDERVLRLLALQQPMAVDLRFLAAVLKIGNDLERMGDLAVNIAQGVPRLLALPLAPSTVDLPLMAERANRMLRSALDALLKREVGLARAVLEADDEVDRMRDAIFRELLASMSREPQQVERGLALLFVARNLERIADHATNIAEDVIFWIAGVDVRHHFREQPSPAPASRS